MDYEKKYNEALSQARFYYENCPTEPEKKKLEKLFPFLRESEDEKVRQRLVTLVEQFAQGLYKGQMLSYLEKQKEQKPAEYVPHPAEDIYHAINGAISLAIDSYEPVRIRFNDVEMTAFPDSCVSEIVEYYFKELNKKNQGNISEKWSEEDEKILEHISNVIDANYAGADWQRMIDWLNNLRPQPKQEWSEEDEKMVRFYAEDYDNNLGDMPMCDVIKNRLKFKDWLLNRLKFLRPQPHWKPSEEQMEAFKIYLYEPQYIDNSEDIKIKLVESLYNDLKKLM